MIEPTAFYIASIPRPINGSEEDVDDRRLADKLRDLRLCALQTNPEAFASSYAVEIQRGIEQTLERLKNPQATHYIVIDRPLSHAEGLANSSYIDRLVGADWLGMIVLIGPILSSTGTNVSAKGDALTLGKLQDETPILDNTPASTLKFHLTGTFVHPRARNKGMASALLEGALAQAGSEAQRLGVGMCCSVLVDSENVSAKNLYTKAGFIVVGDETYTPLPRELLNESVMAQRVALRLELVREVKR